MSQLVTFGAAILEPADGTALVTAITTFVTDNIPALIIVIGFGIGFAMFRKMANRSSKGKL